MSGGNIFRVARDVVEDLLDDPADGGQGRRDAARTVASLDRVELVAVVVELGYRMVRLDRGEPPLWPDEQRICEACGRLIPRRGPVDAPGDRPRRR